MQTTLTRLDHFVLNVRALGFGGTKEEWDETTAIIRTALRCGIGPNNAEEAILFDIVKEIWGDLL